MAFVSRDPYARSEVHRITVKTKETCRWCGNNCKDRLFSYYVESDGGRQHELKGLFCSIGCLRAYHNLGD
jgi:hypothetical protein